MPPVSLSTSVGEILQHWHFAAALFIQYKMFCPACELAAFETLQEVLQVYNVEPDEFLLVLNQMISQHTQNQPRSYDS